MGKFFSSIGSTVDVFFSNIQSYPSLYNEYQELLVENKSLQSEIKIRDQIQFDNERLTDLLNIVNTNSENYIPAYIIYRYPDKTMNFLINKGSNSSIQDNMAVVTPIYQNEEISHFQLLGKTVNISLFNSEVLSLFDENSNVSIRNIRNNENGTVSFDSKSNFLFVKFYKKENFQKDDILVVSAYSSLPNNLIVGSVVKIIPTESIHFLAIIEPVKDFANVSEVLLIK